MDKHELSTFVPLRRKLLLMVSACTIVILGSIITYNTINSRNQALKDSKQYVVSLARDYASRIQRKIEKALNASNNLALAFSAVKDSVGAVDLTRMQSDAMIRQVLAGNSEIYGIFVVWEPNQLDGLDMMYDTLLKNDTIVVPYAGTMDSLGRYVPYWYKDQGKILVEFTEAFGKDWYQIPKATRREMVVNPTVYKVDGKDVYFITLETPILYNNEFYGLVGVDIAITDLQEQVTRAGLYEGQATISIIANDGTIAAWSREDSLIGLSIEEVPTQTDMQYQDLKAGREGEVLNDDYLQVYVPIFLGKSEVPWQVSIQVPASLIMQSASSQMWQSIFISIPLLVLALIIIFFFVGRMIRPLNKMAMYTEQMATGDLTEMQIKTADDEIGRMKTALNNLAENLRKTTGFAHQIGEGKLETAHEALSDKDVLSNALIEMRDNLKAIKKEDEKRVWRTQGQAKFGELLRAEDIDLKEMAYRVIRELVLYLEANQGGIFFVDHHAKDEKKLWLAGSYAWNRRKHEELRIAPGEGLAGQCYAEGKTIFMTDVPDDYIRITSGIGEAVPSVLLIVPMIVNEEIMGVIEIAGFNAFKPYQIAFVERIGESIAVTLSAIQTNENTRKLLNEATRAREELQAQEEELRQNQEELQATHEEQDRIVRKLRAENKELKAKINGLDKGNKEA